MDITNGACLETYVIPGEAGSGVIGINGAAAHLVHPGDLVIIMAFALLDEVELAGSEPQVVHVDADNRVLEIDADPGHVAPGVVLSCSLTRSVHAARS